MKLICVRLLTGDFPAAFAFWRDVMQLPVKYGPDIPGTPASYAYFDFGEVGLELLKRDDFAAALGEAIPAPAPTGYATLLNLRVDDLDATYADLVGRGATSVSGPHDRPDWGARTAHLADPDGHLIEIYSPLA